MRALALATSGAHCCESCVQVPRNTGAITLEKSIWQIPETLAYPDASLVPLRAGETIQTKRRRIDNRRIARDQIGH